jgi:predicted O-methyltransferase YrrM
MEDDDAPIFRYLYRHAAPARHLEFGTWQGTGALFCLEECDATVWTLNLLGGEWAPDGGWAYGTLLDDAEHTINWSERQASGVENKTWHRTDAFGFIGRFIHEKGLAHRVCQVYCDSRQWDTSKYPAGFFDSALIDGGHQEDVVVSDTHKALPLVRSGGLIIWHDFCPRPEVYQSSPAVRGVCHAIAAMKERLDKTCSQLFWVEPSWMLVGIKA